MKIPGAFSQRDPRWSSMKLGTSLDSFGREGCLVTSLSNMLWYMGHPDFTPVIVNHWLTANGGYANGDLVIWGKVPLINPDIKAQGTTSNLAQVNQWLETEGHFAILQLTKAGFPMHFSVAPLPGQIIDSWDGELKPISSYRFITAHLYGDATPAFPVTPQPPTAPKVVAPSEISFTPMGGTVTVTTPDLQVRSGPATSYPGNQANTTHPDGSKDGLVHAPMVLPITGYTHGQSVQGIDIWLRSLHGNWFWGGGTDSPIAHPAPAPAPVEPPAPAPDPVTSPTSDVAPAPPEPVKVEISVEPTSPSPLPDAIANPDAPKVDSVQPIVAQVPIIPPAEVVATQDIYLYDIKTAHPIELLKKGRKMQVVMMVPSQGKNFFRTDKSVAADASRGDGRITGILPYGISESSGNAVPLSDISSSVGRTLLRIFHKLFSTPAK